jgi:hypothetical protein
MNLCAHITSHISDNESLIITVWFVFKQLDVTDGSIDGAI